MVYFLIGFEPYFLYFLSKPVIPTAIKLLLVGMHSAIVAAKLDS